MFWRRILFCNQRVRSKTRTSNHIQSFAFAQCFLCSLSRRASEKKTFIFIFLTTLLHFPCLSSFPLAFPAIFVPLCWKNKVDKDHVLLIWRQRLVQLKYKPCDLWTRFSNATALPTPPSAKQPNTSSRPYLNV